MLPAHVYVHVPFCARRCAYCDFAIAVRNVTPVDDYLRGLRAELDLRYPRGGTWAIDTLYFGGGTPSRLGPDGVARMVATFAERTTIAAGAEVTLEANPEDVTLDAARAWRRAGITRLSLGVQSFDDDVLRWMHRVHDGDAAARAVETVREAGFDDFSLDLIFALPEALRRVWPRDLERAIALGSTHVSLYGLTVEPRTPLARWRERGEVDESPEERYEEEYLLADRELRAAGFDHYEVSNFGRPGRHARHNSAYWRLVPYAGLGPSAHEYDGATRRWNVRHYAGWLARLDASEDPIDGSERLTAENEIAERVYLGLRTSAGLALGDAERAHVRPWLDAGWGQVTGDGRLVLNATGWLRLDALARDLTMLRSRY